MRNLEILSKVYELLAEHESDEFEGAAATPGVGESLRLVLGALADARLALAATMERETTGPSGARAVPARRPVALVAAEEGGANGGGVLLNQIESLLVDQAVFSSNRDLVNWLESLRLPLEFRYREGRPRIVKKFIKFAEAQPPAKQRTILKRLQKQTFSPPLA
jgi:hypothetical protein